MATLKVPDDGPGFWRWMDESPGHHEDGPLVSERKREREREEDAQINRVERCKKFTPDRTGESKRE